MIEQYQKWCNGEQDAHTELFVIRQIHEYIDKHIKIMPTLFDAFFQVYNNKELISPTPHNKNWLHDDESVLIFVPKEINIQTPAQRRVFAKFLRMVYFRQFGGHDLKEFLHVFEQHTPTQYNNKKHK